MQPSGSAKGGYGDRWLWQDAPPRSPDRRCGVVRGFRSSDDQK